MLGLLLDEGKRVREGVSEARVLKRIAYDIMQADVDVEEDEITVRGGGQLKFCYLHGWRPRL